MVQKVDTPRRVIAPTGMYSDVEELVVAPGQIRDGDTIYLIKFRPKTRRYNIISGPYEVTIVTIDGEYYLDVTDDQDTPYFIGTHTELADHLRVLLIICVKSRPVTP